MGPTVEETQHIMAKYLVVDFDRYDTEKTKRTIVKADSTHHAVTVHIQDADEAVYVS